MEETKVLLDTDEALRPLLELAQESAQANVSTIRTVVLKALSDPKVFAGFDEIKSVVQPRCQGPEGESILRTLDLFSYGTYGDYHKAAAGTYLTLTDSQIYKLRQLTVITLVQQACSNPQNNNSKAAASKGGFLVPYKTLAVELGFLEASVAATAAPPSESVLRQVEEVVLACVYARVVAGNLCQKSASLFISSRNGPPCRPRDVPLSQGAAMLEVLKSFHTSKLKEACLEQERRQQDVLSQLLSERQYQELVVERTKKADLSSVGGPGGSNNPALICGGGSVRGWPDGQDFVGGGGRGSSSSGRRQSKRSRAGVSGALDSFNRF